MSKFKVGDRVKVVDPHFFGDFGRSTDGVLWVNSMRKFIGKVVTITEVEIFNGCELYYFDDGIHCAYSGDWLEKVEEKKPEDKFKPGDTVRIKKNEGNVKKGMIATVVGKYDGTVADYLVCVPEGAGWSINSEREVIYYREIWGITVNMGSKCYFNVAERYLEAVEKNDLPKRRIVIEITDDGAEAKYIVGKRVKKTAEIKRYYADKSNDRLAAYYAVGKLFGEDIRVDDAVDMRRLKHRANGVKDAVDFLMEEVKKIK